MSTYVIADAINKLADNLKYAIGARNQIEKEKLAFEKEKFEFNKQQLNLNENAFGTNKHYECEVSCNHDWRFECHIVSMDGCAERHRCAKCGEVKTMKVEAL